jgi:hypothetical protein
MAFWLGFLYLLRQNLLDVSLQRQPESFGLRRQLFGDFDIDFHEVTLTWNPVKIARVLPSAISASSRCSMNYRMPVFARPNHI